MLRRIRTLAHWFLIAVALVASPCTCCLAATTEVPVALLADPHFDPFRDVSKVPRLAAAPVDQWSAILGEPAAPSDAKAFRDLQTACNEGSVDAANDLTLSAFHAAAQKDAEGAPAFVMLAGDLLVHRFDCRYEKLLGHPAAAPGTKYDDAEAHPAREPQRESCCLRKKQSATSPFSSTPAFRTRPSTLLWATTTPAAATIN